MKNTAQHTAATGGFRPKASRSQAIAALASRMSRTGAKGTTLDYMAHEADGPALAADSEQRRWSFSASIQGLAASLFGKGAKKPNLSASPART